MSKTNPPKDFPLWQHPSGRWAKKIKQRVHYFGSVTKDPKGEAALQEWLRVRDDVLAGREPRAKIGGLLLQQLVNEWLKRKQARVRSGELEPRTFADYSKIGKLIVAHLGKYRLAADVGSADFASLREVFADGAGTGHLIKRIQVARALWKYGFEAGLLEQMVRFGPDFRQPSIKTIRSERATRGTRLLTPDQIKALIAVATTQMKGMILLGCNVGYGNTVHRWLWPEAAEAVATKA